MPSAVPVWHWPVRGSYWHWPVLDSATDAVKPAYAALTTLRETFDDDEWQDLLCEHDNLMTRVAREITTHIHAHEDIDVPETFVVAVLESQRATDDYNALVRASVEPNLLQHLDGILYE